MDADFSDAVSEVFCKLYDEGLIYKDTDSLIGIPLCKLHYQILKFPMKKKVLSSGTSSTNTIRTPNSSNHSPETLLGDMAVAVNPKDKSIKNLSVKQLNCR